MQHNAQSCIAGAHEIVRVNALQDCKWVLMETSVAVEEMWTTTKSYNETHQKMLYTQKDEIEQYSLLYASL